MFKVLEGAGAEAARAPNQAEPDLDSARCAMPGAHSRRGLRLITRSAGVRLAIVYALVFGLSTFALVFSLWYSTVGLLQRQVEAAVRIDGAALNYRFLAGGIPGLALEIQNRLAHGGDAEAIYFLAGPDGSKIAGNLDKWPAGLDQTDKWYELPVTRLQQTSAALLRAYALQGGSRLLVGRDVHARSALRRIIQNGLIWAMSIMAVLGLIGAFVIRSLFRRMILDIAATTRAIARGDFTSRVPETGHGDEFDELAGIINDMLDRIVRLMDGVRQVSNSIAHDLRTPVTRARNRLEYAARYAESSDDLKDAIERATADLDGIVAVFHALLRIAEIEAGTARTTFTLFDLTPLMSDIDELYQAVAEERGLTLQARIAARLPVLGDRELIQQAVTNLIENALKFSPELSQLTLTAGMAGGAIEICVADRGPGIPAQDRARATERFFRADLARNTSGSGLGLALVAAVARLHNGTLRLEENHPGLRAVISIPAQPGL